MTEKKTIKPLNSFIEIDELKEDIQINPGDLNNAFLDQASHYLHYSILAAKAQHQADRAKQTMSIVEAEADREIRDSSVGTKKPTEAQISKEIVLHPRFKIAQKRYHEAKEIALLCREAANSFLHRRDMIVQAAKSNLEERRGELRLVDSDLSGRMARAVGTGENK